MSEPSLFDSLLECGCRPDVREACDLCQVIKPEVQRLRAKLQAAEEQNARLIDGSMRDQSLADAALSRAEAAEAESKRLSNCALAADNECDELEAEVARLKEELEAEQKVHSDAATNAFDEIAAICGCPEWHYPGQIVRDVLGLRDALRTRIAELEAENNDLIVKVQFAESVIRDEKQIERTATEAALRWAWSNRNYVEDRDGFITRGLAALLETAPDGTVGEGE